jgi:hypothetical protein
MYLNQIVAYQLLHPQYTIILSCEKNRFASSANIWKSKRSEQYSKSLIYKRNNNGPKTEPWGTPQETYTSSELIIPLIETYYFLFDKYDLNHSLAMPRIP